MDYKYHTYYNSMFPIYNNCSVQEDDDGILVVPTSNNDMPGNFYYFYRISNQQPVSVPDNGEDAYYQIDLIANLCTPRLEGYRAYPAIIRHVFTFCTADGAGRWRIDIVAYYSAAAQYPSSLRCYLNTIEHTTPTTSYILDAYGWGVVDNLLDFSLGTPPNHPQKIHFDLFYGHNGSAGKLRMVTTVNEVTVFKPISIIVDSNLDNCGNVRYMIAGCHDYTGAGTNHYLTCPGAKVLYMAVR